MPVRQKTAQRLAHRRHAHRQTHFADKAIAGLLAGLPNRGQFRQRAADMRQDGLTAGRRVNARMSAFEESEANLIFESSDPTTHRGSVDPE